MLLTLLGLISAGAFYYYGFACWFSVPLRLEYLRYGVPHLRVILGTLQVLGSTGILVGFAFAPIGAGAAAGLSLMMVIGVAFRRQLGDSFRLMIPATILAVLNGLLVLLFSLA